jgi:hypothetical protein
VACLYDTRYGRNDHDKVRKAADGNADDDCFISTQAGVGDPRTEDRESVGEEMEQQVEGIGELESSAEGTGCFFSPSWWSSCAIAT